VFHRYDVIKKKKILQKIGGLHMLGDVLHHYLASAEGETILEGIDGPTRILKMNGKRGVNATSIHTKLCMDHHNLNDDEGTVSFWMFALEDLSAAPSYSWMGKHNAAFAYFPLLTDVKEYDKALESQFSLMWDSGWYPQFNAKFYRGSIYPDAYAAPQKAVASANHFHFDKHKWYHVALTWSRTKQMIRLYMNGILAATEDRTHEGLYYERCGDRLYAGNPMFCMSDIKMYGTFAHADDAQALYEEEPSLHDEQLQQRLTSVYAPQQFRPFQWEPDAEEWSEELSLTLASASDLEQFYVQGCVDAPSITKDGLLVETPMQNPGHDLHSLEEGKRHVYLWTEKSFEGDLYVEYEFNPLQTGGLSLLMVQATGMQREDFMNDYERNTSGTMSMVCWEDVRNYHWEYYREMNDVRNDLGSNALIKNPFQKPLAFGMLDEQLDKHKWHKLQFLQIGNRLTGAINGRIVWQVEDDGHGNSGPVLSSGHIAIRCMIRTRIMFRNLKVYNRQRAFQVSE
jgi:hypothetical protein